MTRVLFLVLVLGACKPVADPAYVAELDAWHRERIERLTTPDGWLSLAGLHWLGVGDNSVGSAAGNDVRLPAVAAETVGVLRRQADSVHLSVAPGVAVTVDGEPFAGGALASDRAGKPTVVAHRRLLFFVIARGDRIGLRVKDLDSPVRVGFRGIERYPVDPAWRIEARFEAHPPGRTMKVTTVVGTVEKLPCPGVAVFERGGREHHLNAVKYEGADELFFVFADYTNLNETYGAGRFLYTPLPVDGRVVLDFNRAYSPPCAFTPHATCPLPSSLQNKIRLRVEAGEKRYAGGH